MAWNSLASHRWCSPKMSRQCFRDSLLQRHQGHTWQQTGSLSGECLWCACRWCSGSRRSGLYLFAKSSPQPPPPPPPVDETSLSWATAKFRLTRSNYCDWARGLAGWSFVKCFFLFFFLRRQPGPAPCTLSVLLAGANVSFLLCSFASRSLWWK